MNKAYEEAIKILEQYAKEQQTLMRGTTDLSPLEEWLLIKLIKAHEVSREVAKKAYNEARNNPPYLDFEDYWLKK